MLRWCWLVTLAACGFRSPAGGGGDDGGGGGDDAAPVDGSSKLDAPADTGSSLCFGSFVRVCLRDAPSSPIMVNSGDTVTYNTQTNSTDCVVTTPDVGACVVAATSISVNGTIRGMGPRPLVLLATDSITINSNGVIDVASRRDGPNLGAGANPPSRCQTGTDPTERTGGWGGSNASKGGDGNEAGGPNSSGGKAANALPRPTALFGGCAGGKGASGSGGNGGAGGGAIDLIAAAIVINGTVNASGAGAKGASDNGAGGGGAGGGGLIVLDAMSVTINGSAKVFAQGGGGGEGGRPGDDGNDGADPATPGQAAAGGSGAGTGGDGGAGATTGNGGNGGDDSGITPDDGGGGGGGGRGFIITTDPTPPSAGTSQVCPAFS
jgi:hypothetical protein